MTCFKTANYSRAQRLDDDWLAVEALSTTATAQPKTATALLTELDDDRQGFLSVRKHTGTVYNCAGERRNTMMTKYYSLFSL